MRPARPLVLERPRRPETVAKTVKQRFEEHKVNRDEGGKFAEKPGSGATEFDPSALWESAQQSARSEQRSRPPSDDMSDYLAFLDERTEEYKNRPRTLRASLGNLASGDRIEQMLERYALTENVSGDQLVIPSLERTSDEFEEGDRLRHQVLANQPGYIDPDVQEWATDVASAFNYTTKSGYRFEMDIDLDDPEDIEDYFSTPGEASFRGNVYSPDGQVVGRFERTITDGTAYHETFTIDHNLQGEGIGSEWLSHVFESYNDMGIHTVVLSANMSIGGYAWAKMGFDWDYPPMELERGLENIIDDAIDGADDWFDELENSYLALAEEFEEDVITQEEFVKRRDELFEEVNRGASTNYNNIDVNDDNDLNNAINEFKDRAREGDVGWVAEMPSVMSHIEDVGAFGKPVTYELLDQIVDMKHELANGNISSYDFSQWLNEPEYRREEGEFTVWPGKEMLLGSSWRGTMHLL